jgi:hypothetical protein
MKTVRALSIVALLALASGNALASSPTEPVRFECAPPPKGGPTEVVRFDCKQPRSGKPAGGARALVSASPDVVRTIVLDYANYAYYFDPDKGKNPKKKWASKIVGKKDGKTDLYLEVPILKGAAHIWAILRFDPPKKDGDVETISGRMIKGNVDNLEAKWKISKTADGETELRLEFFVDPTIPVPDSLLFSEARGAAGKAVKGMQGEALKRAGSH